MLKSYITTQGMSVYKLSKMSHIPYSTLNDLINHKLSIENMKSGQLRSLADSLSLDMNAVYDMCAYNPCVISEKHSIHANISVEHKAYFINFEKNGQTYKSEILPVKKESTTYLDTLALWKLDEVLDELELEAAYESLHS